MKPKLQVSNKKSLWGGIISTFLLTVMGMYPQTSFIDLFLARKCNPKSTLLPLLFFLESLLSLTTALFGACKMKHLWVYLKAERTRISVKVAKDNCKVTLTSSSVLQQCSLFCFALTQELTPF